MINFDDIFFRIVGKGIPSEQYQIKNVPKKSKSYKGFKFNEGGRISNASSAISDISTVTLTEDSMKTEFAQDDDEEEIIGKGLKTLKSTSVKKTT